jgi:putative transposase
MGQSLVKNYIHIVFSTKHRLPWIIPPHEEALHAYLAGICKKNECHPIRIGGYTDHIHILCLLSQKITLMKLVEELKSHSSKWIKTRDESLQDFYWQTGYGAFSVHPNQEEIVVDYISNQQEHHKTKPYQQEFRGFLKKYKVDYDEKYVWD